MKIAIFPSYGNNFTPKFIKDKLPQDIDYDEQRVFLAQELEKLEYTHDKLTQEIYDNFDKNNIDLRYIRVKDSPNIIYVKDKNTHNWISIIKIVDVDTNVIWRVREYDGTESIEYFQGVKVINEKLNIGEW